MAVLTKKYRLIWVIETKIIVNDYKKKYSDSVTIHPDNGPNGCFESDLYSEILDKIRIEKLKDIKDLPMPEIPEN
jgi:hypothetical protein